MAITITLTEADGGTDVYAVHDGLPPGLSPTDNATRWRMSPAKLAALVEAGKRGSGSRPGIGGSRETTA
jgi:hypothetical protein